MATSVEAERLRRGWTIAELAWRASIRERELVLLLAGERRIAVHEVFALARAFEIATSRLLPLEDESRGDPCIRGGLGK